MEKLLVAALALVLVSPVAAVAEKKDKKKEQKAEKSEKAEGELRFSVDQRGKVQMYFVEKHGRGHCPPGLAKKHNGCLPPGQAKKRYTVGQPLPAGFLLEPLPSELHVHLGAPPAGYRYGVIDGDVVKLAVATMLVVDAIQGLVE